MKRAPAGRARANGCALLVVPLALLVLRPIATGAQTPPETACSDLDRRELASRLERLLDDPALARAHVGVVVQETDGGEVLFERHAARRFTPASTAKLVTAAVALERLGAGHRWTTRLVAGGPIRDGVLAGDLWVVGGGDPTLERPEVRAWAARLREAGIERIAGDLVGDDRLFPGSPWGEGWMWEDLHAAWGSGVSALGLSPAGIRAELRPAPLPGAPASLVVDGEEAPPVENRVRTGTPASEPRLSFEPSPDGGAVRLVGWIPVDGGAVPLRLAPGHPTLHLLETLERAMASEGIRLEGRSRRARDGDPPPPGPPPAVGDDDALAEAARDADGNGEPWSAELASDSLGAVLPALLRPSDNQIAEVLLRGLGRARGDAGTAAEGLAVVEATLDGWGIGPDAATLVDGSGLSRYDALAPAALVRLLRRARQLPWFEVLQAALPVAGESGTLAGRLVATAGSGNVLAKTGSMTGVRGLAGYVRDADGETLAFALLLNGFAAPGDVASALEDLLVEQLALYHGPDYPEAPCARP